MGKKKQAGLTIQKKNKNKNERFETICKFDQNSTKLFAMSELINLGYEVVTEDGFLYAKGTHPVLLVAHMDTVHKNLVKNIYYNGSIVSSPQGIGGDDRCGIYMVLEIVKEIKCSVVFTEDEEIGCIGANKFCKTDYVKEVSENCNYIIEFDRKGTNDAVFYDCDNKEFEEFITKDSKFTTSFGSLSDISYIAPETKLAAVNLSCGYDKAHTTSETVDLKVMNENIQAAKGIILKENDVKFEYIELEYGYSYGSRKSSYYDNWYGDYDSYYGDFYNKYTFQKKTDCEFLFLIQYRHESTISIAEVKAVSEEEAVGKFLMNMRNLCYEDIIQIMEDKKDKDKMSDIVMFEPDDFESYRGGGNDYYFGNICVTLLPYATSEEEFGIQVRFENYCTGMTGELEIDSNSSITDNDVNLAFLSIDEEECDFVVGLLKYKMEELEAEILDVINSY